MTVVSTTCLARAFDLPGVPHGNRNTRHHEAHCTIGSHGFSYGGIGPRVLRRNYVAIRLYVLVDERGRPRCVVRLYSHEPDVKRLFPMYKFVLVKVIHRRVRYERIVGTIYLQAVFPNRLDLIVPHVDQCHIVSGMGQPPTNVGTNRPSTDEYDSFLI